MIRTVKSVQKRPFGYILILLENFSPFALDESEVIGDFMAIKPGDTLLKRGDKYQKTFLKCLPGK
jgi:hypothetical protein